MHRSILTIARSEYLRRVRTRGFIIGTLLAPIMLVAFGGIVGGTAALAMRGGSTSVAVVDSSGVLLPRLKAAAGPSLRFHAATAPLATLRDSVQFGGLDGVLVLPAGYPATGQAQLIAGGGVGLGAREALSSTLDDAVRAERLARLGISDSTRTRIDAAPGLAVTRLTESGEQADTLIGNYALGFAMGMLIYIMTLLYGSFVMQGVIEEKQTRVAEVMISAVKPFDLMLGKVLGMGAVSLTQLVLWVVLAGIGLTVVGGGIAAFSGPPDPATLPSGAEVPTVATLLPTISPGVIVAFLVFFAGGYLLYSSLFAAIGSAVEQPQEAQGLTLPVMLPIIGSFLCLQFVMRDPNTTTATLLSMVPFFAPVLMPPRIALTDVPLWEIGLSLLSLVLGFIGTIWVAARIYRVGILSYGKRPTLRDLWRWLRYAG